MKEHCDLREPRDVHCWRESEDPKMLAMCCRLLAKTKVKGEYVSLARMREALEAARKLYALPEERKKLNGSREARYSRHSALLYRRLPMELAIRLGELDIAKEILSQGLCQDGFCDGGTLEGFLMVPGVGHSAVAECGGEEVESLLYFRGRRGYSGGGCGWCTRAACERG